MSKEIIHKTNIKRKTGKLYFIDSDGDICEGVMCGITQHNPPQNRGVIKILKLGLQREESFLSNIFI